MTHIMETKVNKLIPFKATHPGEILGEELKARGIKQKAFAEQIGMQPTHLSELIKGKRNITSDIAMRLENALGIPYKNWMNLQSGYDYDCKMIAKRNEEEAESMRTEAAFREMVNLNYLYKNYSIKFHTSKERIKALLERIAFNPLDFPKLEVNIVGYFKRSDKLMIDDKNMRTWLLLAWEAIKSVNPTNSYKQGNALLAAIEIARMANDGTLSIQDIKNCLSRYGIIYVEIDKLPHSPIDAYSAKINGKMAIAVTYRHNDLDKLAFDILHELCHLDRHITNETCSFISIDNGEYSENKQENEANKFAQDTLIPADVWNKILKVKSNSLNPYAIVNSIAREAAKYGISKTIAVARYKHDTKFYETSAYRSPKIFNN